MHPALVLAAAWAGGAYWWHRRVAKQGDWRELAYRMGLPVRDLGEAGIELQVPGMRPVRVERGSETTRLWTTYAVAGGPRFAALPKDHRDARDSNLLERRFGPATWLSLSPRFEHSYWTFTRERDLTSKILADSALAVIDTLLDEIPGIAVASYRRIIELSIPDPQPSPHGARAAVLALVEMANRDIFGVGALRALPRSRLVWEPCSLDAGDHRRDLAHGGPVVSIPAPGCEDERVVHFRPDVDLERDAVMTEVYSPHDAPPTGVGHQPTLSVEVDDEGRLKGQVPRGSVPIAAALELPSVGGGHLSVADGITCYRWNQLVTEQTTLLAGARLVSAFARERH